jgi:hypothetical protein
MISFRTSARLERQIDAIAARQGRSRSALLKDLLEDYVATHGKHASPYELGKDLFGKFLSGNPDLSRNRKTELRRSLTSKHEKRRAD